MARIVGIDHAINDIVVEIKTPILDKLGVQKGDRKRIDDKKLEKIIPLLENPIITAGGTVRNVIKNLSSFGESTGIIAAVGRDKMGERYKESLNGIQDMTLSYAGKTGTAITYITEDRERSFQTCLGVSTKISKEYINAIIEKGLLKKTDIIVLSGFLFENKRQPIYEAGKFLMEYASSNRIGICLGLGGENFLKENSGKIKEIINGYTIDIISLNEAEANILTRSRNHHTSSEKLIQNCKIVVITRGRYGIHIMTKDEVFNADAEPLQRELKYNKNGAGDAVFSTVIYEYANRTFDHETAGKMAAFMAKRVMCSGSPSIDEKTDYESIRKSIL